MICAFCNKEGHTIYNCFHATQADKDAFKQKVLESKKRKLSNNNNSLPNKPNEASKRPHP